MVAERRARFEPLWRAALAEFGEDELLGAAAILDRLGAMFYDVADAEASQAGGPPAPGTDALDVALEDLKKEQGER
jgi:hypothetical protein